MKYYGNFNFTKRVRLSEMADDMFFTLISSDDIVLHRMTFNECMWVRTSKKKNGRILCYRYNCPEIRVFIHFNKNVYI